MPDSFSACIRCSEYFKMPAPGGSGWEALEAGVFRHVGGFLRTPQNAEYCARCGPNVHFCFLCGCTDEAGCLCGCYWSTDKCNVCSACVSRAFGFGDPMEPYRKESLSG